MSQGQTSLPSRSLELLLFVDRRTTSTEQMQEISACLAELQSDCDCNLQVIDVGEQAYLVEHFKLVATPALIKLSPGPRQTLVGSNLATQLETWWPRWQAAMHQEALAPEKKDLSREGEEASEVVAAHLEMRAIETWTLPSIEEVSSELDTPQSSQFITSPGTRRNRIAANSQYAAEIAEIVRLSEEIFHLKQARDELKDQLQFKDRIIAMLAHDLRNPLTAASIAMETLEMGLEASQTAKLGESSRFTPALMAQLVRHARTQTKTIDLMITDLLQAARGSQSDLQLYLRELALGDLCCEMIDQMHDRFQAKSQTIERDLPSDLPTVYADPERLRQVIVNLLDNAAKYTPKGGTIRVSALHRTTQKVQLSVCDDGPGIPEENLECIFEDRFRLKRDETQEGYGIGLALCRRIIRAHYGQIWVESEPNLGSCFHITLPVYRI